MNLSWVSSDAEQRQWRLCITAVTIATLQYGSVHIWFQLHEPSALVVVVGAGAASSMHQPLKVTMATPGPPLLHQRVMRALNAS